MPDGGARELSVAATQGVCLNGEAAGEGRPIVLLHGLTATHRYVLMGSRSLERSGHLVVGYDARGHGASSAPQAPTAYAYEDLANDLECVLDSLSLSSATLAGVSMGAHTAVRFALEHPDRVDALALITPGFDPELPERDLAHWDALADGLRENGVEGFVRAYDLQSIAPPWRDLAARALRQRMELHTHPGAVADALEVVPRSRPFASMQQLGALAVRAIVIASRDEADPEHPFEIAERYAEAIPGAALLVEEEGSSPLAWQGGRVSRAISALVTGRMA
jgi:pimeloyl-ACP methyl ester carboxylesterase